MGGLVLGQRGQELADDLDIHGSALRRADDDAHRGRGASEIQRSEGVVAAEHPDALGA
jgi:hypothetical protein